METESRFNFQDYISTEPIAKGKTFISNGLTTNGIPYKLKERKLTKYHNPT